MTLLREWRPLLVCLIALAWTFTTGVTVAARDAEPVDRFDQQSAQDTEKPKTKKKKKKKDAETQNPETSVKVPKHPQVKIGNDITLQFHARIEGDLRGATADIGRDKLGAEWQDRRLGIEGDAFGKRVSFQIEREFKHDLEGGDYDYGEKTPWRDVYVNYRVSKALNFEAGRFKLPFGREETTAEKNLDFVYRSLAARVLSPGRDIGVMTHGRLFKKLLEYQVGYFTRDGDHGRTTQVEGGTDAIAARVVVAPFVRGSNEALEPLEIGINTENSRLDARFGLRGRTVLADGIFFDRVYVNGHRHRVGVDAQWAYGPVSLTTEYITVSDQRLEMGFDGTDLPDVRAHAWYLTGTWTVTGERKKGRVVPRRDLFRGGFGAIELAARVEKLSFDTIEYPGSRYGFPYNGSLTGNADRVTTLGVNWYVNRYLKLSSNVVRESIDDPQRSPAPVSDGKFTSVLFFFQFRI